jgi:hypothetical protein
MSEQVCIFCFKSPSNPTPWCPTNPGNGCTYGLGHEYPLNESEKPKQPPKKPDKQLCLKCGLHAKNPASATNGCSHEYPA